MNNYRYIDLHKKYLDAVSAKHFTFADLLRAAGNRPTNTSPEDGVEQLELSANQVELIQEQVRAFCSTTLADTKDIQELYRIHYPGKYTRFSSREDSPEEMFMANLVDEDGSTKEYHLDQDGQLCRWSDSDLSKIKIINSTVENALKAFLSHQDKLTQDRRNEISRIAAEFAKGDVILEGIIQLHLQMEDGISVHPTLTNLEEVKYDKDKTKLPRSMTFYRVGRNASHEFYLGVYQGQIYRYSCGEDGGHYIDEDGQTYTDESIDWDSSDGWQVIAMNGKKLSFESDYSGYISGPFQTDKEIGYLGHF